MLPGSKDRPIRSRAELFTPVSGGVAFAMARGCKSGPMELDMSASGRIIKHMGEALSITLTGTSTMASGLMTKLMAKAFIRTRTVRSTKAHGVRIYNMASELKPGQTTQNTSATTNMEVSTGLEFTNGLTSLASSASGRIIR